MTVKHTPFYDFHKKHKARFVDFAGWQMPIMYSSIIEEHNQVRNSGGLFDVSHMGRVKFSGRHARRFLERVLTRRVSNMKENTCRYSMICNDAGGVLDDVLVYRFPDHWLLVNNAANHEKLMAHFEQVRGDLVFNMEDQTESTAMVAVQGPKVMDFVSQFSSEVPTLKKFHFRVKNLMVLKMTISRTGYTGEDGVEVIMPANMAGMALKLLMNEKEDSVIKPAGLGARDTLRMEAAMPLYGHELDEQTDPFSAGLDFAVSLDKDEHENGEPFIGQNALKKIKADGPPRQLIGLAFDGKRTPRQGKAVYIGDNAKGAITSGCMSPTLAHPIAMAFVDPSCAEPGTALQVDFGKQRVDAEVVPLPFHKPESKK